MATIEGNLQVDRSKRVAIISTRWNHFITDRLLEGAKDSYIRHGGDVDSIDVVLVPGAFELPLVAGKMLQSRKYDAIVCLGAVIRGATPHFDYISAEATKGIASVALKSNIPISFGLLTTDTIEQAIERAGTKAGNKGGEAMTSVIEMLNLYGELEA